MPCIFNIKIFEIFDNFKPILSFFIGVCLTVSGLGRTVAGSESSFVVQLVDLDLFDWEQRAWALVEPSRRGSFAEQLFELKFFSLLLLPFLLLIKKNYSYRNGQKNVCTPLFFEKDNDYGFALINLAAHHGFAIQPHFLDIVPIEHGFYFCLCSDSDSSYWYNHYGYDHCEQRLNSWEVDMDTLQNFH